MKQFIFILVLPVGVLGFFFYVHSFLQPEENLNRIIIHIDSTTVEAEVADTVHAREKGLSGRKELADGQGMLFVFDEPGKPGIWMKHTSFPLDVLWIGKNRKVLDITQNITPDSYPEVFYPSVPILYALEVPAGFVEKYNIDIGNIMRW